MLGSVIVTSDNATELNCRGGSEQCFVSQQLVMLHLQQNHFSRLLLLTVIMSTLESYQMHPPRLAMTSLWRRLLSTTSLLKRSQARPLSLPPACRNAQHIPSSPFITWPRKPQAKSVSNSALLYIALVIRYKVAVTTRPSQSLMVSTIIPGRCSVLCIGGHTFFTQQLL